MTHEYNKIKRAERREDGNNHKKHVRELCELPGLLEGGAYFDRRKNRIVRYWKGSKYTKLKKEGSKKTRRIANEEIFRYMKDDEYDACVSREMKHAFDLWWEFI